MGKDYYKILGIEKGASKEEVKRAFRALAHTHHPDKGGDEAKFKEINEAYQVLGDEEKRKQYDQFGTTYDQPGGGGFGNFNDFYSNMNFEDLGDIFGSMFGGGRSARARGDDIAVDVRLTFKESIFGVEKELTLTKNQSCDRCGGTGGEPGTKMNTCDTCKGSGMQITAQRTMFGTIQSRTTCRTCGGSGEIPKEKCSTCKGTGLEYKRTTLRVEIPPGVEDGNRMRVRGQGESLGASGAPGDLYVSLHVETDPRFERQGEHLFSIKRIGFSQAALGDEVVVETVDGSVKVKIPAGTQHGDKLRLRQKGVPTGRGRGDHLVIVHVMTPKKLSRSERKILEELNLREE
ncbi:MAG: molecular chaperone DnaJ [Patescibacteria group bacterium]|jgi:molecular chaperone DnaJ